jgi:dihydrofolate synthase/folylpolyglutamate synthase
MISKAEVIEFCSHIQAIKDFEPSFFEISFAMALYHFHQKKCEYCVIEVGMGGRLDATNCITPLVSVITTIGLDHTQFLGDTRTKIAGEKAGIIKQTIPVIIGEKDTETQIVFEEKASQMNSDIQFIDDLPYPLWIEKLPFPFNQGFQKQNAFTAFCTIQKLMDVSEHNFFSAIHHLNKNTGYQKRLELVSENPRIILDVSHNLDGIKATLNLIEKSLLGKLYIVYGSSSDKDYRSILAIFPHTAHVCLTPFQSERSWKKSEMEMQKKELSHLSIEIFSNVNEAIFTCKEQASEKDTILVFGSFFLIQDISI